MPESSGERGQAGRVQHHARWVRISHWIVTVSLLTLAFSGFVILMAHPRLYWGEVGNGLTPALLELPISRNHQQPGDPAKLASAILELVNAADPPLRLPLGPDTLKRMAEKNALVERETSTWRPLAASTDH